MKNKIKKLSMLSVLMVLGVMFFVACTKPQRITLSAENNLTTLTPGQSVLLTNALTGDLDETGRTYTITGHAKVDENNVLLVNANAEVGSRIEVYSSIGLNKSNTLVFTVGHLHIQELQITSSRQELSANTETTLNVAVSPQNATVKNYNFKITKGEELAEVLYNPITKTYSLRIKDVELEGGEKIVVQVYAEHNNSITDEIEFTLIVIDNEIYTTHLNLTANKTSLFEGEEAVLNVEVIPQNATVREFSFEIVSGEEYAEVLYNQTAKTYTLKVKENNLQENKTVLVKVFNNYNTQIYSELEFEVLANTVKNITISNDKYFINTKAGATNPNLNAIAYDRNFKRIANQEFEYSVVTGAEFLEVDTDGYLNGTGHGVAVVRVSAKNDANTFAEAEVTIVNPPEKLELPTELALKTDLNYSYSLRTKLVYGEPTEDFHPAQPEIEFIPFKFDVSALGYGDYVNNNVVYTFKNGEHTGNNVAVYNYETNEITFKKLGKTIITATSSSSLNGYNVSPIFETSVSFTVNVNNGFNVNTYEQFKYYMEHLHWTDENHPIVNVLADLKPTAANLALGVAQNAISSDYGRIVYGNGYSIDVSEQAFTGGDNSLIRIWNPQGENITAEFYDLSIYGNFGINGDIENENKVNENAIRIFGYRNSTHGETGEKINSYAENVIIKNVHIYGFREGIYLRHVVNGLVTDSSVTNIFYGGILSSENIIEFRNMTYSNIGHFGLYITPNETENVAGKNFNQVSQVKISGYTYSNNLNNGTTKGLLSFEQFFSQYGAEGITSMLGSGIVKYIEQNNWNGLPQAQNIISHFRNDSDEYNLFSIAFLDAPDKIMKWGLEGNRNGAIVNFQTDELMGSMIKISDLDGQTINTTHKFIVVDAVTTIGALGGGEFVLGQMILANLNYQGNL